MFVNRRSPLLLNISRRPDVVSEQSAQKDWTKQRASQVQLLNIHLSGAANEETHEDVIIDVLFVAVGGQSLR
jgi:hypothetical protein